MALINIKDFIGRVIHPIGSLYITDESVNPASLWGGAWEKWENYFLLGAGSTYPIDTTGGSNDGSIITHTHTINSHNHEAAQSASTGNNWNFYAYNPNKSVVKGRIINNGEGNEVTWAAKAVSGDLGWASGGIAAASMSWSSSGSSATNANMPPYKNVHIWHRIG